MFELKKTENSNDLLKKRNELIERLYKNDSEIKTITVWDRCIDDQGVIALMGALKNNSTVNHFALIRNKIGIDSCKAMAQVLEVNQTIRSIYFIGTNLDEDCVISIMESLKDNQTVTEIVFDSNKIGHKGFKAIADLLKSNRSVEKISLCDTGMNDRDMEVIAEALKFNDCIMSLDLSRKNSISHRGIKVLNNLLKNNHVISRYSLLGEDDATIELRGTTQNSLAMIERTINAKFASAEYFEDVANQGSASLERQLLENLHKFPNSSIIRLLMAKLNLLNFLNVSSGYRFNYFKLAMQDVGLSKRMQLKLVPEMSDILESSIYKLGEEQKNISGIIDLIILHLPQDHPLCLKCQAAVVNMLAPNRVLSKLLSKQNDLAQCCAFFKNIQLQSPELLTMSNTILFVNLMKTFDNKVDPWQSNQTMDSLKNNYPEAFAKTTNLVNQKLWLLNPLSYLKSLSHFVVKLPDSSTLSPAENNTHLAPFKDKKNIFQLLYKINNGWQLDRVLYFKDEVFSLHNYQDAMQDKYTWDKPLTEKIENYFPEIVIYNAKPASISSLITSFLASFWQKNEVPVDSSHSDIKDSKQEIDTQNNVSNDSESSQTMASLGDILLLKIAEFRENFKSDAFFINSEQRKWANYLSHYIYSIDDIDVVEFEIQLHRRLNKDSIPNVPNAQKIKDEFDACLDELEMIIAENKKLSSSYHSK